MERLIRSITMGPLGVFGPIMVLLLCPWLGRGERSPWYVKAILFCLLVLLLLITLGYI